MFLRHGRRGDVDEARIVEVLEPAPERVEARCPHYGRCGGCSLMHLEPAAQRAHKQAVLLADFEAHGVAPERVLEPLFAEPWRYRRRARLGAKWVEGKGKVLVGFREKDRRFVADLDSCEILAAPSHGPLSDNLNQLIPALSRLIEQLELVRKIPQIEVSVGDDALALVFRVLEPPSPADLDRLRAFGERLELRVFIQPKGPASIEPVDPGGEELLHDSLPEFELELGFRPTDFVQVNGVVNRAMIARTLELLELEPDHRVLDLFCGLGNFSLPIARRAGELLGVEGEAGLVERARANARANGIDNARFLQRDLYAGGELDWLGGRFDRVLLDPPRSGAAAIVESFDAIAAPRVVYVACSPETLARDAGTLVHQHGYRLSAAGIIDMFPHTAHLESIALFERTD